MNVYAYAVGGIPLLIDMQQMMMVAQLLVRHQDLHAYIPNMYILLHPYSIIRSLHLSFHQVKLPSTK